MKPTLDSKPLTTETQAKKDAPACGSPLQAPAGPQPIAVPFADHTLRGDGFQLPCETLVLHGAGQSSRSRFAHLRQALCRRGIPSASFDFIGHGDTGGRLPGSSLRARTEQAAAVIQYACREPLTLIAASMSGYTAIKLTERFRVANLILLVPAVYTPRAYDLPFGPDFSAAIRQPGSWQDSDAFSILAAFRGNLLVVAAEGDDVIPRRVVERLHASADSAGFRKLHIVPGSGHLSLFAREEDFREVLDMMAALYRGGPYDRADVRYGHGATPAKR